MSHTPGPWEVITMGGPRDPRRMVMVKIGGKQAADCTNSGDNYKQDLDNARLIAAAPDLFAALRELEAWAALVTKGECAELTPARVQARAAIARAEGK